MNKKFWFMFVLGLCLMAYSALVGVIYGHNAGVHQALERVCVQTNGKYDFCQETVVKKYSVSIPDPCMEKGFKNELTEEEWQNCFGTPVFDMNKRNKK